LECGGSPPSPSRSLLLLELRDLAKAEVETPRWGVLSCGAPKNETFHRRASQNSEKAIPTGVASITFADTKEVNMADKNGTLWKP
jgi:hypothetical protein